MIWNPSGTCFSTSFETLSHGKVLRPQIRHQRKNLSCRRKEGSIQRICARVFLRNLRFISTTFVLLILTRNRNIPIYVESSVISSCVRASTMIMCMIEQSSNIWEVHNEVARKRLLKIVSRAKTRANESYDHRKMVKGEKLKCSTTATKDHSQIDVWFSGFEVISSFADDVVRCSRPLRSVIEILSRIAFRIQGADLHYLNQCLCTS